MGKLLAKIDGLASDFGGGKCELPEFSTYLPHPTEWKQYTNDFEIKVSSATARIILANYKKYGSDCIATFEPLLADLKACI